MTRDILASAMEHLSAAIVVVDDAGAVRAMNPAAERLTGRTTDAALGTNVGDVCALFDAVTGAPLQDLLLPGMRCATFRRGPDGSPSAVAVAVRRIPAGGCVIQIDEMVEHDREQAIARAEENLRVALTAARQGLYELDLQTGVWEVSPEYARMLGYEPAEFRESTTAWYERLHPDDREHAYCVFQDCVAGRTESYRAEFRQRTRPGGWKWILSLGSIVSRSAHGVPLRMLGTHTDIDERKSAEEATHLRELAYLDQRNALIDLSALPTNGADSMTEIYRRFTECAARTLQTARASVWLTDGSTDEIVCMNMYDRIRRRHSAGAVLGSGDAPAYFAALLSEELIAADDALTDARTRELADSYLVPEGIASMLDAPIRLGNQVVGVLCHEHVGPKRRFRADEHTFAVALASLLSLRLEEAQRRRAEGEARLRVAALDAAANGIVITDVQGRIVWVNAAFTTMTGYTREEVTGGRPGTFLHSGDHGPAFYADMWHTILRGDTWIGQIRNRRKDGTLYTEGQTITPMRDDDGAITHFIAIKTDLSERLRMESELHQSQKLESVGRLAGGIAHDFNNLLTVINGTADLAVDSLASDDPTRAEWEHVRAAGSRAALLTGQLLAFSRKQVIAPEILDFHGVVGGMAGLVRRLLPERLDVVFAIAQEPGYARADRSQIEQVVLNLVVNARDAMPRGGTLTVQTADCPASADGESACVELRVSDTGTGMSDDVLEHIFEPFFTTKGPQRGTGLGLSTVYGIVQQNGGRIEVASSPGLGTTFTIRLPGTHATPSVHTAPAALPERPANGTGRARILVVEDEAAVRDLVRRMLETAGYDVLTAADGAQGVDAVLASEKAIDLVLTDMVMPGMDGPEVAARIAAERRHTRVLFTSGYSDDDIPPGGPTGEIGNFLAKPFTRESLLRKVGQVLRQPTRPAAG